MTIINKRTALQYLVNVPDEFAFECCDGTVLRRMLELAEALGHMSEATFRYHSGIGSNEFADWVRDAIGDVKLAKDLSALQSRQQYAERVRRRVEFLRCKLNPPYAAVAVR